MSKWRPGRAKLCRNVWAPSQAIARSARALEETLHATRQELPSSLAAVRLTGMELSDCIQEFTGLRRALCCHRGPKSVCWCPDPPTHTQDTGELEHFCCLLEHRCIVTIMLLGGAVNVDHSRC